MGDLDWVVKKDRVFAPVVAIPVDVKLDTPVVGMGEGVFEMKGDWDEMPLVGIGDGEMEFVFVAVVIPVVGRGEGEIDVVTENVEAAVVGIGVTEKLETPVVGRGDPD